jgi:hypothetical protein
VVYWCNSYTIVHLSLDIIEWFKYKLKKVFKLFDTDSPPSFYSKDDDISSDESDEEDNDGGKVLFITQET